MPVTWCYQVSEKEPKKQYCSTGFPVGCYVDNEGRASESCAIKVSIMLELYPKNKITPFNRTISHNI